MSDKIEQVITGEQAAILLYIYVTEFTIWNWTYKNQSKHVEKIH